MRLTQHIVVSNCALAHEHQQVTTPRVFHSLLPQRRRVEHNINRVAYLNGNVIADGAKFVRVGTANPNISDSAYYPLRCGLAKRWKCCQTHKKDSHEPQHSCSSRLLWPSSHSSHRFKSFAGVCYSG